MNLGSLFVALGIIAFYGALIVVVTSLLWVDKKPHRWKIYHYISYVILVAVFLHGLMLGTDLSSGIGKLLWYIGGVLVLTAIIIRLRRVRSI
jgi:DMSO/TMAO reductase YedYZ heme-binding membrane subunit